jgi:Uncharacterised nucleotidyltransferase/Transglutaminase-like superfamily
MSAFTLLLQKSQTWRKFPNHDRWLLSQALILLPCVALFLKLWGFQRTYALLGKFLFSPAPSSFQIPETLRTTNALLKIAIKYHQWATCLPRSLVLWYLLRCQGIAAELQIGTRFKDGGFQAHAWVEYQGTAIGDLQEAQHPFIAFDKLNQKLPNPIPQSQTINPEIELLRYFARARIDNIAPHIETLLQNNLDWNRFLQQAHQQGIFLLLNQNLTHYSQRIPQHIQPQLQAHCQQKTARNLFLAKKLCQILDCFHQHHINVIPFKGSVLSVAIYNSLVLREFEDIDLLIDGQDFPKVKEILSSQGYQPRLVIHPWEQGFTDKGDNVHLDIHWQIAPAFIPYPVDFSQLWQRRQTVSIFKQSVNTLSPEDLLLILCVQTLRDAHFYRERLKQICDIAELIRHTPLNWEFITQQAQASGAERSLFFGLAITQQLLDIELPMEIQQRISRDRVVTAYVHQTIQHLFKDSTERENLFGIFQEGLWTGLRKIALRFLILVEPSIFVSKRNFRLIKHLLSFAFTPNAEDRGAIVLPHYGRFLYYVVRPIRLSLKFYRLSRKG